MTSAPRIIDPGCTMTTKEFGQFNVATAATGAGTAVDVSHLEKVTVTLVGTFVGTYALQISQDGTNWVNAVTDGNAAASATAPAAWVLANTSAKFMRINCSAFTSGQGVALYGGQRLFG